MGFSIHVFILSFLTVASAKPMMRRVGYSRSSSLRLDEDGIVEVRNDPWQGYRDFFTGGLTRGKATDAGRTTVQEVVAEKVDNDVHGFTRERVNTCNFDYPLGVEGRTKCAEPGFDYIILEKEMCLDAAERSGIVVEHSKFKVHDEFLWRYPMGCFKLPCATAHADSGHAANATDAEKNMTGYCYFYNPVGTAPPEGSLQGAPVCYRPKVLLGEHMGNYKDSPRYNTTTNHTGNATTNHTVNATTNHTVNATTNHTVNATTNDTGNETASLMGNATTHHTGNATAGLNVNTTAGLNVSSIMTGNATVGLKVNTTAGLNVSSIMTGNATVGLKVNTTYGFNFGSIQPPNATCKDGFQVIKDLWTCHAAAKCLGMCLGAPHFEISSEINSQFEYYPEGCFQEESTKCVFFNPRPPNWPNSPRLPVGTPICNVSHVTLATDWPTPAPAIQGNYRDSPRYNATTNHTGNATTNHTVNSTTNHTGNATTNHTVNVTTNHTINAATNHTVNATTNDTGNETATQLLQRKPIPAEEPTKKVKEG